MKPLTKEQQSFARDCVSQWFALKSENREHSLNVADPDHSSLLGRLLAGEEPLPYRPPLSFSYPNPELALRGGEVRAWFNDGDGWPNVAIDQNAEWALVEGDESGAVVVWPYSGMRYRLDPLPPTKDTRFNTHTLTPLDPNAGGEE